jgi:hypothetical protein
MLSKSQSFSLLLSLSVLLSCGEDRDEGGGSSYSFSSVASTLLTDSLAMFSNNAAKATLVRSFTSLCTSVICFTPTAVTGKYFGVGLLIQSEGNGLSAYFGQDEWGSITGSSPAYSFNIGTPITNAGDLWCCNGRGDLANGTSYISDVTFLLKYVDVTFTFTGSGAVDVDKAHTLRFVFANLASDDADAPNALRGDILYFDSGAFKWVDADGDFHLGSGARPSDAINQDDAVTNWSNPWGTVGQQSIPTVGSAVKSEGGGVMVTSETELKEVGRTYSFKFPVDDLIVFPDRLHADAGMINSLEEMLEHVHMAGLPHGSRGVIGASDTELSVD